MKEIKINVFEQIGGNAAVSTEDGDTLYKRIEKSLSGNAKVTLDFINIDLITSTFLNAAIGQLYNKHDSQFLNDNFEIENLSAEDIDLLKKVIERAKEYFKDKKKMDKSIREALDEKE